MATRTKNATKVFVVSESKPSDVFYSQEAAIAAATKSDQAEVYELEVTTEAEFRKREKKAALETLTAEQRAALGVDRPKKTRKKKGEQAAA